MKIIKEGILPDDRKYYICCYYCMSEVIYEGNEKIRTDYSLGGTDLIFVCPTCGTENSINIRNQYRA